MDTLEKNKEYSRQELQAWLETRSRICSTQLWLKILEGKEVFEVGDQTYKLTPTSPNHYLVKSIKTSILIFRREDSLTDRKTAKLILVVFFLACACAILTFPSMYFLDL